MSLHDDNKEDKEYEYIEDSLKVLSSQNLTEDDLEYSDNKNLSRHNEEFSELLTKYVDNYAISSDMRLKSKRTMFVIAVVIFVAALLVVIAVLVWSCVYVSIGAESIIEVIPAIVGAVITMVGTFMVVPQIIANYLYNADEEKYLADIIGKIQEYDSHIRDGR